MKTHIKWLFVTAGLCISSITATSADKNPLLANAGFEIADKDGKPAGWRTSKPSRLSLVTEAYAGHHACCLELLDKPAWSNKIVRGHVSRDVKLQAGRYCYSGMIRGTYVTRIIMNCTGRRRGKTERVEMSSQLPRRFGWKPFEFIFKIPEGLDTDSMSLNLWFFGERGKPAKVMLDALQLERTTRVRNYIPNSGFEKSSLPGIPDYWRNYCRRLMTPRICDARLDPHEAAGGSQSICLYFNTKKFDKAIRGANRITSMFIYPDKNKIFTFSAWMKADKPGVKIDMYMSWRKCKTVTLTTKWARYHMTDVMVPAAQHDNRAFVNILASSFYYGKPLNARIWIDNIQVEQNPQPSPYSPAPEEHAKANNTGDNPELPPIPSVTACRTNTPPKLDGILDEQCWNRQAAATGFVSYQTPRPVSQQTAAKITWDNDAIYIGFTCNTGKPPRATITTNDSATIFADDVFELFMQPDETRDIYFHWAWNAKGAVFDEKITFDRRVLSVVGGMGRIADIGWNSHTKVITRINKDGWSGEARIPLFHFAGLLTDPKHVRINICRENPMDQEISCWSFTRGTFHSPTRFGRLTGLAPDLRAFVLRLGTPVLSPDILAGCCMITMPILQAPADTQFQVELPGSAGKKTGVTVADNMLSFKLANNASSTAGKFTVMAFSAQGRRLFEHKYSVEIPPVMTFACSSLVFPDEKRITCVLELNLPQSAVKNLAMEMQVDGNPMPSTTLQPKRGRTTFHCPLQGLRQGYHTLRCCIKSRRDGNLLIKAERKFGYFERPLHYVRFSPTNRALERDGRPFLPRAIGMSLAEHLLKIKAHGFNTVWFRPDSIGNYRVDTNRYMRALADSGMSVIINFGPILRYSDRLKLSKDAVKEKIRAFIRQYHDHPSILFYQVLDEPTVQQNHKRPFSSAEELAEMHWFVKNLDPYHPVFVNWGPNVRAWRDLSYTDIMAYDYYSTPISPTERTIDRHNFFDDHARRRAMQTGKLFFKWMELDHGCTELGIRLMQPEEERCVTFLSLVNGVRALSYFCGRPWNDNVWEELADIGQELDLLTPVLCAPDTPALAISDNKEVRTLLKQHDNSYYLFVVNSSAQAKTMQIHCIKNRFDPTGQPLFARPPQTREIAVRPCGKWQDSTMVLNIEGYGMRVFVLSPAK